MGTIGPILHLPWGPIILTIIGIIILEIVGEICWKSMPHYTTDDEPWNHDEHFEIKEEDWKAK